MAMFFRTPWAQNGDRTIIPNDAQGDGSLSYTDGFTADYQGDYPTDPQAKPVPRLSMNEILYETTLAIQQYQTHGFPDFITTAQNGGSPYSYDIYAIVRYNPGTGVQLYISIVNNNTSLPTDTTRWMPLSQFGKGPNAKVSNNSVHEVNPSIADPMPFDTINFDTSGIFQGPPSYAFKPGIPGYYRVYAVLEATTFVAGAADLIWAMYIFVNGVNISGLNNARVLGLTFSPASQFPSTLVGSDTVQLNSPNDIVQLRVNTNIGRLQLPSGRANFMYFGINYLGPL